MAEFGAHVTSSIGEKPSIFEVLAQQSLENGLRGAFRYLFKVLAESNPENFGRIQYHFEELYTLLDFLIQYIHLKINGASFAESFYGLRRIPIGNHNKTVQLKTRYWLPKSHFYRSLILLVVFPYFKIKLEYLYKSLKDKESNAELGSLQERKKKFSKFYLKIYPYVHFLWEFVNLSYQIAYAVGHSCYHTPLLHMSLTQLRTLTNEDQGFLNMRKNVFNTNIRLHNFPYHLFQVVIRSLAASISVSLSTGAFFLQFLDWWYSQDNSTSSLTSFPIPPPPKKWPVKFSMDICPLCNSKRRNTTVLSSSGFVFCYRCIFRYVETYFCCPITGYPSTTDNLIKLYPPNV